MPNFRHNSYSTKNQLHGAFNIFPQSSLKVSPTQQTGLQTTPDRYFRQGAHDRHIYSRASRYSSGYDCRSRSPRDRDRSPFHDRPPQYGDESRRRSSGENNLSLTFSNSRDVFSRAPPRGPKALIDAQGPSRGGGYSGDFRGRGRGGGRGRNTWSRDDVSRDRDRGRDDFRRDSSFREDRSRERLRDYRDRDGDMFPRRRPSPPGRGRSPQTRDFRDRDLIGVDAERTRRESRDGPLSAGSSNPDLPFGPAFRGSAYTPRGARGGRGRADYDRRGRGHYDDRLVGDRYPRSRSQDGRQDGRTWSRDDRDNRDIIRHPSNYDFYRRDSYVCNRENDDDRNHRDTRDLIRSKPERPSIPHDQLPPKDVSPPPLAPPAPAFGSQIPRPTPTSFEGSSNMAKPPPTGPRAERPISAGHSSSGDARLSSSGLAKTVPDRSPTIPLGPRSQTAKLPRPSSKQWINPALKTRPESPQTIRPQSFAQHSRPSTLHDSSHDHHSDHYEEHERPRSSGAKTDDGRSSYRPDQKDNRIVRSARASMEREHYSQRLNPDLSADTRIDGLDEHSELAKTPISSISSIHDESEKKPNDDVIFADRKKLEPQAIRAPIEPRALKLEPVMEAPSDSDDEEEIESFLDAQLEEVTAKLAAIKAPTDAPTLIVPQFYALREELTCRLVKKQLDILKILGPALKEPEKTFAPLLEPEPEIGDIETHGKILVMPDTIIKDETNGLSKPLVTVHEPLNRDNATSNIPNESPTPASIASDPPPIDQLRVEVISNIAAAITDHDGAQHIEQSVEGDVMDIDEMDGDALIKAATEVAGNNIDTWRTGAVTEKEASVHSSEPARSISIDQPASPSHSPGPEVATLASAPSHEDSFESHAEEPDSETDLDETADMGRLTLARERITTPSLSDLPRYKGKHWSIDKRYRKMATVNIKVSQYILSAMKSRTDQIKIEQEAARQAYAKDYEQYIRFTVSDDPVAVKSRDQFLSNPKEEVKEKTNGKDPQHENMTRSRRYASERDVERIMEMSKREEDERQERLERAEKERRASEREAVIPDMYWTEADRRMSSFPDRTGLVDVYHLTTDWEVLAPINNFTDDETAVFEKSYLESNKFWGKIAEGLSERSYQGCIQYYYLMKRELNLKEKLKKQPKKRKPKQRAKRAVTELGNGDVETDENIDANDNGERRRPRRAAAPTFNSENAVDSEHGTPAAATPGRRRGHNSTPVGDSGPEKPDGPVRKGRRGRKEKEPKHGKDDVTPHPPTIAPSPIPAGTTGTPGPTGVSATKANRSRSSSHAGWASPQLPAERSPHPAAISGTLPGVAPPFVAPSTPLPSVEKQEPGISGPPINIAETQMPPQLRPELLRQEQVQPGTSSSVPPPVERTPAPSGRARGSTNASSYWSVAESENFPGYLKAFGSDWSAIASYMETKTPVMVSVVLNYFYSIFTF